MFPTFESSWLRRHLGIRAARHELYLRTEVVLGVDREPPAGALRRRADLAQGHGGPIANQKVFMFERQHELLDRVLVLADLANCLRALAVDVLFSGGFENLN